ncbi:MAG TPA: lipase family protein [Candidatus Dormibacteraeota bacterium]|jgi:hypothetical protein|nr:lipase family protein [Candidatus Dormibacteraeota bacterium]
MLQRSWRGRLAVGAAAAAALLAAPGSQAPAAADAAPSAPDQDPFYRPAGPVAAMPPGTILGSRPVTVAALGLPLPLSAWQLRYATRDGRGRPEAAVATVILPGNAPRTGPRPLVSYQVAEDSLATTCAPSYEMRLGREGEEPLIGQALTMGWAVVVPDYEGPDSQWTAGTQAGHAVLDGVRAALRFGPAGLAGPSTPLGLWGYSGGAQATAWATELQPTYAPELRITGAAEGGVPADVEQVARTLDGGFASGLLFGAAVGLNRAYPEMQTDSILNAKGRAAFARIGGECIDQFTREYAFQHLADYTTVADPLALPAVRSVIAADRLGQRIPAAPLYIFQARFDELIPASQVQALVRTYCAAHATVQYQEDLIGEHVTEAATGAPGAVAYLAGRFNGLTAPSSC